MMSDGFAPENGVSEQLTSSEPVVTMSATQRLEVFGVPLPEGHKRTPAEVQAMKERIGLISRVFSRNYGIDVGPSGGGWSCSIDAKYLPEIIAFMKGEIPSLDHVPPEALRPKRIAYDVRDVEGTMTDQEILGVVRHEVGHANHSSYRRFFEGERFAIEDGFLPSSWAEIFMSLEDPYVNNKEIADSDAVRENMRVLYRKWVEDVVASINSQTLTHQLSLNVIYYWLTGEQIPTLADARVREVFEKIRPSCDRYFSAKTADEAFGILKNDIWDEYKTFEKLAVEEEMKKETVRQMAGSDFGRQPEKQPGQADQPGEPQSGQGQGNGQGSQSDQSQESQGQGQPGQSSQGGGQGESRERSEPGGPSSPSSASPGQGGQPSGQSGQASGGSGGRPSQGQAGGRTQIPDSQLGDEATRAAIRQALENQARAAAERQAQSAQAGGKASRSTLPDDIDLSQIPPELQDAVAKVLTELTDEQWQALAQDAKEQLDVKQAAEANKSLPAGIQLEKDPETGTYQPKIQATDPDQAQATDRAIDQFNSEQDQARATEAARQRQAEAAERARSNEQQRRQAERAQMVKDGFNPDHQHDLEDYQRFRTAEQAMVGQVDRFLRVMERYLPKKENLEYGGAHYSGSRLNMRELLKKAPLKDYQIFERREAVESTEPRLYVELLIDNTGSMAGQKMAESLKTAIFLARILERFEIPAAIKYFGDRVIPIMNFGDHYDDPKKRIKPRLIRHGDASANSTDLATPLSEAIADLTQGRRKYPGCHGAIFMISDGGANSGPKLGADLRDYLADKQKTFTILNFLLSANPTEIAQVQELFGQGNTIVASDFSQLPEAAFRGLRLVMERVLKIYRSIS